MLILQPYIQQAFNKVAITSSKVKKLTLVSFFKHYIGLTLSNKKLEGNRLTSVDELCQEHPKLIANLFENINLEHPGLEEVREYINNGDYTQASHSLIKYFRKKPDKIGWKNLLPEQKFNKDLDADHILNNEFIFQRISGIVPQDNDSFNWSYLGSKEDSEWAWFLNRHYHVVDLFHAYLRSGNSDYVQYIYLSIRDWILTSIAAPNTHYWAQWRGREVACRILHWAPIFYGLLESPSFSEVDHLLMLAILPVHGNFLRHCHTWGANWLAREMNGLATLAICWPEFKFSQSWLTYAQFHMSREINLQVYPDGSHKELTSHYHRVTLLDFNNFAKLIQLSGHNLPISFAKTLERMWNYLAFTMRPDGSAPLNNDSDRDEIQTAVQNEGKLYNRSDWQYIASNGQEGECPLSPSIIFPWAGQVIMRSSWEKDAHWGFFDVGPHGINYHTHNDKLHLSIAAFGRDLLVDSGRYHYKRDPFWHYFRNSASHNTILVDGQSQNPDIGEALSPVEQQFYSTSEFDFAYGKFDQGYQGVADKVIHSRFLVYLRHKYWIVIDRVSASSAHQIQALWHFHPDCDVEVQGPSIVTTNANCGNLRIVPTDNLSWDIDIAKGRMQPVQGWWSKEYNHKQPNPTVIYSSNISTTATFAWILCPALGVVPQLDVQYQSISEDRIQLEVKNASNRIQVSLCLDEQQILNSLPTHPEAIIQVEGLPPQGYSPHSVGHIK
ncbi:alginate lyase family protein [Acaryochloris sp. 'Moss Beach']|uniref:alginate lyase family protein n=1 Tax=Acaryochloris sp. 'Moss Beach' TaxID=2740837 RepID=UPI001F2611C1|nr:alginate lyase family protein [Acaryochloris sp. 'Moss Beach']UJB70438.1 alginate lyase family protein [Acaryochloris sp. 'Moss Beach']